MNSVFLLQTHIHFHVKFDRVCSAGQWIIWNSLMKPASLKILVNYCKTKGSILRLIYDWFIAWTVWVTVTLNCNPKFILVKLSLIVHQWLLSWWNSLRFLLTYSTLKSGWQLLAKSDLQHIKWRQITSFVIYKGISNFFSPGLRPD